LSEVAQSTLPQDKATVRETLEFARGSGSLFQGLRLLPRGLARAELGAAIGSIAFSGGSGGCGEWGLRNLELAFSGEKTAAGTRGESSGRNNRNLGLPACGVSARCPATNPGGCEPIYPPTRGLDNYRKAKRTRGKGVLVLTGHLGRVGAVPAFYHSLMGMPMGDGDSAPRQSTGSMRFVNRIRLSSRQSRNPQRRFCTLV